MGRGIILRIDILSTFKERKAMKGVSYIMDDHLNKKAVVIDMKLIENNQEGVEDLLDTIVAESRKGDATIEWEDMKKKLRKKGKL